MSVKQTLIASLVGARFSNMEGRSFCSSYVLVHGEGDNDAGQIPMKIGTEPKLFLELRDILEKQGSPADVQFETIMKPASQGGMKMHIVGVRHANPTPAQRARDVTQSPAPAAPAKA